MLYRNTDWFADYTFSYDMSVPNVGHLDPQPGGCCTVFPYFIGNILEIPLTTTQDYPLFHVLRDYSIDLWRKQINLILQGHGLISTVVHPDYVIEKRARATYSELLAHLASLGAQKSVWLALPRDVQSLVERSLADESDSERRPLGNRRSRQRTGPRRLRLFRRQRHRLQL